MFMQVVSDHSPRDLEKMGVVIQTTIPTERYVELLMAEEKLRRLEAGGVDSWEWYSESLNPEDQPRLADIENELGHIYDKP